MRLGVFDSAVNKVASTKHLDSFLSGTVDGGLSSVRRVAEEELGDQEKKWLQPDGKFAKEFSVHST